MAVNHQQSVPPNSESSLSDVSEGEFSENMSSDSEKQQERILNNVFTAISIQLKNADLQERYAILIEAMQQIHDEICEKAIEDIDEVINDTP